MADKRVLVVDDSATVREQVSRALSAAGFEVVEASDGRAGADLIASDRALSLVIADVNMPCMNGIEMLEEVRRSPATATLPVLMLTTEGQPALMRRAKAAGAAGWIVKPFQVPQLVAAVQRLAR